MVALPLRMITMYHGTRHSELPRHAGLCLCETAATARAYAGAEGTVYAVTIDDDLLSWDRVEGYDRDTDTAPADRRPADLAAELDVSAVWYTDEDPRGRAHDTLRLLTTDALAAIVAVESI